MRRLILVTVVVAGLIALHLTRPETPIDLHDCERFTEGPLRQPGNAISALLLVAAGVVAVRRFSAGWFGWAVTGAGVGSFAVHATAHPIAGWADLVGVAAVLVTATSLVIRHRPGRWLLPSLITLGVGLVVWALSRTGGALCDPDLIVGGHAVWHGLAALAALLFARSAGMRAGRTPAA